MGADTAQLSQAMTQAPFQKPLQLRFGPLPAASLVKLSVHRDQVGQGGQSRWRKIDSRDESQRRRKPPSHRLRLPADGQSLLAEAKEDIDLECELQASWELGHLRMLCTSACCAPPSS